MDEINTTLLEYFPQENFTSQEREAIHHLLKYDKKNAYGRIYFVLLEEIGKPKWDIEVPSSLIQEAFDYYSINH